MGIISTGKGDRLRKDTSRGAKVFWAGNYVSIRRNRKVITMEGSASFVYTWGFTENTTETILLKMARGGRKESLLENRIKLVIDYNKDGRLGLD